MVHKIIRYYKHPIFPEYSGIALFSDNGWKLLARPGIKPQAEKLCQQWSINLEEAPLPLSLRYEKA